MQDLFAILIALTAAAFLAYRGWQHFAKRRGGCGACSNCPSDLVTITPNVSHAKAQSREDI